MPVLSQCFILLDERYESRNKFFSKRASTLLLFAWLSTVREFVRVQTAQKVSNAIVVSDASVRHRSMKGVMETCSKLTAVVVSPPDDGTTQKFKSAEGGAGQTCICFIVMETQE